MVGSFTLESRSPSKTVLIPHKLLDIIVFAASLLRSRICMQVQAKESPSRPRKRMKKETPRRAIVSTQVSSPQERKLFFELLEEHNPEGRSEIGWSRMSAAWNTYLSKRLNEGSSPSLLGINPKTPFHLRDFFREHTKMVEVQQAINFSPALREEHTALNNSLGSRTWSNNPPAQHVPSLQPQPTLFSPSHYFTATPSPFPPLHVFSSQHPAFSPSQFSPQAVPVPNPPQVAQYLGNPSFASLAYDHIPAQPLRNIQGANASTLGPKRPGGRGKGKTCTSCGKPTLGHKKKSCN